MTLRRFGILLFPGVAGDDTAGKVQLSAAYYPAATRYGRQAEDPRAPAYVRAG